MPGWLDPWLGQHGGRPRQINGLLCQAGSSIAGDHFHTVTFNVQEEGPEASFGERLQAVRDPKHFHALVAGSDKLVVDFYAPWCGKCRMISPFVEQLMDKHSDVTFVKFGAWIGLVCGQKPSMLPCRHDGGAAGHAVH